MQIFIDTHAEDIIVILFAEKKIIKKKIIRANHNSTLIMPTIKEIISNNKLTSIIVCNGPGSFTGVRLGVTIAKTLAYTMQIPIKTITSLEIMALSTESRKSIVAFSDKNGYFVGEFDEQKKLIGDYKYLSNKEFIEYSQNHDVITNIEINYNNMINYIEFKAPINPHEVNPIYIKKLDVEK